MQNYRLKVLNDSKAFIEYSNDMGDIYDILMNTIHIKHVKSCLYMMIWLLIWFFTKKSIQ